MLLSSCDGRTCLIGVNDIHLRVYPKTVSYSKSKEHVGPVCVPSVMEYTAFSLVITENECIDCAARRETLNIIQITFSL